MHTTKLLRDPQHQARDAHAGRLLASSASFWAMQGLSGPGWLAYVCQVRADLQNTGQGGLSEAAWLHADRLGLYAAIFFRSDVNKP